MRPYFRISRSILENTRKLGRHKLAGQRRKSRDLRSQNQNFNRLSIMFFESATKSQRRILKFIAILFTIKLVYFEGVNGMQCLEPS